jgi:hypothetical protein
VTQIPPTDPTELLRKVAESGMGVRFGRGIVAKTGYAIVGVLCIWLGVVLKMGPSIVQNCFLAAAGLVASGLAGWWVVATQRFAERNPAQAMLEGAEFIEYKRFEAQTKFGGSSSDSAIESGSVVPGIEGSSS